MVVIIFIFIWTNTNGLIPLGSEIFNYSNFKDITSCFKWGTTCADWVIQYDNMNYINANASGKCNNSGVTLSRTNTTCK